METAGTKGRRGCECCLAGRFDVPGRGAVSVFLLFPGEDQSRFVQKRHRFFYPLSYLSIIRRVMDEIRGDLSSLERWKMANFLPTVARLPSTREILSDERDREREGEYRDQSIIFDPSVIPSIAFESLSLSFFIITSNQFSKFILFIPRFCFIYTSISVEEKGESRRKEDKVTGEGRIIDCLFFACDFAGLKWAEVASHFESRGIRGG